MSDYPGQHLLRFVDVDYAKGILYIEQATPLVELLASHYSKLSLKGFCLLLLDIISGLKELLGYGIFYRDIHHNNIYLSDTVLNGRNIYKLGDLGSCVAVNAALIPDFSSDKGGVGSKWFMAPETWKYGTFNERSAVYTVGMVAYYMMNDLYPPLWQQFGEKSHTLRIKGMELPVPCKLMQPNYQFLDLDFLHKSTEYDPKCRYESLDALERSIRDWMNANRTSADLIIIYGADTRTKVRKKAVEKFCSTCTINPYIEVSNGESDTLFNYTDIGVGHPKQVEDYDPFESTGRSFCVTVQSREVITDHPSENAEGSLDRLFKCMISYSPQVK